MVGSGSSAAKWASASRLYLPAPSTRSMRAHWDAEWFLQIRPSWRISSTTRRAAAKNFATALSSGIIYSVSRLVAAEIFYDSVELPEKLQLDFLHQSRIS